MKVGLLTSFFPEMIGGAEASLEALLPGYRRTGLPYVLFTLNRTKRRTDADLVSVPVLRRVPRRLKIAGLPVLDDLLAKRLPPLMEQNGVDLLHVLDTYSLCGGAEAASIAKVPVVFTCQNNIGTPFRSFGTRFPITRWLEARERKVIRAIQRCSMTVAISDFVAGQLASAGIPPSRITTVPTAGAIEAWPTAQPPTGHTPLRVLALGRLQHHKGFQVLLRATARLVEEGRDIRIVIAGRGPYSRRLHRLARDLKLGERVRFPGLVPRSGIPPLLDWSDVVVVPTLTPEPLGRVAIEAMSRGKPAIGSRVGGLPEIIADGRTGWLVNPDRHEELADRLRRLLDQPSLVGEMGRNALSECRAKYSSDTIVRQLARIYDVVRDGESGRSTRPHGECTREAAPRTETPS